jgi:methionyl-tRNA synthetase
LTGSDEHGQKIADTAAKIEADTGKPCSPQDVCDKYAGEFKAMNEKLLISNDW